MTVNLEDPGSIPGLGSVIFNKYIDFVVFPLIRPCGPYKDLVKGASELCIGAIHRTHEDSGCLFEVRARQMPGIPVSQFLSFSTGAFV